jgi:hypothetical protein
VLSRNGIQSRRSVGEAGPRIAPTTIGPERPTTGADMAKKSRKKKARKKSAANHGKRPNS